MPEPTDEELGIPEGLDPNIRAELRRSRELARENESLKAATAAAEKEAAFAKAGVPDTPLAAQLAKTYEGENDPASVKAFFENLGVDLSVADPGMSEAELAAQRQLAQVGSQGDAAGEVRYEDAINSTTNVKELMDLIASAPEGATTHAIDGRARRIGVPVIE